MKLEDLEIYNLSMDLSDKIWDVVCRWEYFNKETSRETMGASGRFG